MSHEIIETFGVGSYRRKSVIATAANLTDAIALAHNMFNIIDIEIDASNPLCADFFTSCGRVMQIEPWA